MQAISLPYKVSFSVILFCMLFFSHSLCVGGAHSFLAEVLIKCDSQFNYFYSEACPLESCSFSLSSYIFYLFSAFLPIFLSWLFMLPNLTSLIISPSRLFFLKTPSLFVTPPSLSTLLASSVNININILGVCHQRYPGKSVTRIISMLISLINKFTLTNTVLTSEDWTRSFFILASLFSQSRGIRDLKPAVFGEHTWARVHTGTHTFYSRANIVGIHDQAFTLHEMNFDTNGGIHTQ